MKKWLYSTSWSSWLNWLICSLIEVMLSLRRFMYSLLARIYSKSRGHPYSSCRRVQIAETLCLCGKILRRSVDSRHLRRTFFARAWCVSQNIICAFKRSPIDSTNLSSSFNDVGFGSLPSTISKHLCILNVDFACITQRQYSFDFILFNIIVVFSIL